MDLLVPCLVEGRSELRNIGRVNCKTLTRFFTGCEHHTYRTYMILIVCILMNTSVVCLVEWYYLKKNKFKNEYDKITIAVILFLLVIRYNRTFLN